MNGPEFFAFETKIRQMVMELIEPCSKRSIQDRDMILDVQAQTDVLQRKVDECEFVIQKAQKKTTATDDLAKQLSNLEAKLRTFENKNFEQVGELQDKLEEVRALVGTGDLERRSTQLKVEAFNGKVASFNDDLAHVKDQMRRQIEDSHVALKKQFAAFTAQIDSFQQAVDLEKAQTALYSQEVKRFLALVEHTQHQYARSMDKFEALDASLEAQARLEARAATQERQMEMAWENMSRMERAARDLELAVDRYLPLQVQNQIDEALYGTVGKKADLLKQMTDHQRVKYKLLEDKLKAAGPKTPDERRAYTLPNFTLRELEIQRIKNNKSKRSDKNDLTSVKSKGSRFTQMKTLGSALK